MKCLNVHLPGQVYSILLLACKNNGGMQPSTYGFHRTHRGSVVRFHVRTFLVSSPFTTSCEWSSLAAGALLARGEICRRVSELDQALADLTWIIEGNRFMDDAIHPQASGLRGLVYSALGKDDLARQDFTILDMYRDETPPPFYHAETRASFSGQYDVVASDDPKSECMRLAQ
jgi:hypothetical protein